MNTGNLVHRDCEHAGGIRLAKVFFGRVRESRQICKFLHVAGVDVVGVKLLGVMRPAVIGVLHCVSQAAQLKRLSFISAHPLFGVQGGGVDLQDCGDHLLIPLLSWFQYGNRCSGWTTQLPVGPADSTGLFLRLVLLRRGERIPPQG